MNKTTKGLLLFLVIVILILVGILLATIKVGEPNTLTPNTANARSDLPTATVLLEQTQDARAKSLFGSDAKIARDTKSVVEGQMVLYRLEDSSDQPITSWMLFNDLQLVMAQVESMVLSASLTQLEPLVEGPSVPSP